MHTHRKASKASELFSFNQTELSQRVSFGLFQRDISPHKHVTGWIETLLCQQSAAYRLQLSFNLMQFKTKAKNNIAGGFALPSEPNGKPPPQKKQLSNNADWTLTAGIERNKKIT